MLAVRCYEQVDRALGALWVALWGALLVALASYAAQAWHSMA